MAFIKASKLQSRLRLALTGPSGSGKTYTALALAAKLGSKVAVLDTEHGSASKYAGIFSFDTDPDFSPPWHPRKFVEAIKAAEDAGYEVLVIDSLSHAWDGAGGLLEEVDALAKRSGSKNTFVAWRDATPHQHRLIEAILSSRMHIICTMRSKTEWILEDDGKGRKAPRKVGMAPVQRAGVEYEFDVLMDLDQEHRGIISKTRCPALDGQVIDRPGAGMAGELLAWLSDGLPALERPRPAPEPGPVPEQETYPAQDEFANQESGARGDVPHHDSATPAPARTTCVSRDMCLPATEPQLSRLRQYAADDALPADRRARLAHALSKPLSRGKAGWWIAGVKKFIEEQKANAAAGGES